MILDVGLPDMSRFETCKAVRTFSQVPVFFLTKRSPEIDSGVLSALMVLTRQIDWFKRSDQLAKLKPEKTNVP